MENSVSFEESVIYTVQPPVSEHNHPKVIKANMKEVRNLEDYEVFEEIVDDGQETISSRWVIT